MEQLESFKRPHCLANVRLFLLNLMILSTVIVVRAKIPYNAVGSDININGVYYNLDSTNKTASVTKAKMNFINAPASVTTSKYSGSIIIPSTVEYEGDSYRVISIGLYAFLNCNDLISVTLPSSITSISTDAFEGCNALTSVNIPESVTSIGQGAFSDCSSLTSIIIPSSVTSIGFGAFSNTSALTDIFCFAESLPTVHSRDMSSRGEIELINVYGELSCDYDNVTLHVPRGSIEAYSTTAPWNKFKNIVAIEDQGIVYNFNDKDKTAEVIKNPNGYSGVIVIPATVMHDGEKYTVTKIGKDAFRKCSELISVSIPNSVKTMGSYAFSESSNLTSVTIGSSLTNIGYAAFWKCSGLVSMTIPNSVTKIEDFAFQYCNGLTTITIGSNVTSIGYVAFGDCTSLTSLVLPASLKEIGDHAFHNCSGLTSVAIPEGVVSIGQSSFYGCIGLKYVDIPESVLEIGYESFKNCTGLTSVSFPESLYRINSWQCDDHREMGILWMQQFGYRTYP